MSGRHFSAVDLEVLWSRLITAVDEALHFNPHTRQFEPD